MTRTTYPWHRPVMLPRLEFIRRMRLAFIDWRIQLAQDEIDECVNTQCFVAIDLREREDRLRDYADALKAQRAQIAGQS